MKAAVTLIEIDREVVYAHILITEGSIPGVNYLRSSIHNLQSYKEKLRDTGTLDRYPRLRNYDSYIFTPCNNN